MDGPPTHRSPDHPGLPARLARADAGLVLLLLLLAAGIHGWLIAHTTVPARDGIGFIRYAWELRHRPWRPVLRTNAHPPLYPLAVMAASELIPPHAGTSQAVGMQLAAQLVSGLAGTLLVVPMFFLGRLLFNRKVAFGAALLFQCLPGPARMTSDALSEGLFLLLAISALAAAASGLRNPSSGKFALCGLCSGLAYLTRPEGLLLIVAVSMVLVAGGMFQDRTWARPGAPAWSALVLTATAVALPYICVTGRLTNKPTGRHFLDGAAGIETGARPAPRAAAGGPLVASMLAVFWDGGGEHPAGRGWRVGRTIALEWAKALHYLAAAAALAGLCWFRREGRSSPAAGLVLLTAALYLGAVGVVGWSRAYVSERHVLLPVLLSTYWAAAFAVAAGGWLADRARPRLPSVPTGVMEIGVLAVVATAGLPDTLKPMHTNRAGHRTAGTWLAGRIQPGDWLVDPLCWAGYYAGRTLAGDDRPISPTGPGYVILERSLGEHRLFIEATSQATDLARRGLPVYRCPLDSQRGRDAEVIVYRIPPPGWALAAR